MRTWIQAVCILAWFCLYVGLTRYLEPMLVLTGRQVIWWVVLAGIFVCYYGLLRIGLSIRHKSEDKAQVNIAALLVALVLLLEDPSIVVRLKPRGLDWLVILPLVPLAGWGVYYFFKRVQREGFWGK